MHAGPPSQAVAVGAAVTTNSDMRTSPHTIKEVVILRIFI
jgi:hypothetical protein